MTLGKILLSLIFLTTWALAAAGQNPVGDLRNLVGIRASSGEAELRSRGFIYIKGSASGDRRFSNFWNQTRGLCITVATVNGRYDSIVDAPPFDCDRENVGNAGGPPSAVVTIYEDYDYRGRSQTFSDGRYLNNRGQLGNLRNDRASSIDVPVGFSARLCDGEGSGYGSGACEIYSAGRHNLPYGVDNRVSYVEVTQVLFGGGPGVGGGGNRPGLGQPGVTVYDDRNFRGVSQSFGVGKYLFQAGQFGALRNDEASSVVVLNGFRVRLCENEGSSGWGGGRCEEYRIGRYNLRYNDETSFIEVTRANDAPAWGAGASPVNVSDLVGVRASSGETQMRTRGFRNVDGMVAGNAVYTIWWRPQSRQCVQVATAGGRYDSLTSLSSHPKCR